MVCTVIGKSGFLASSLLGYEQTKNWRFIPHKEAKDDSSWLNDTDIIINCAFSPIMMKHGYQEGEDLDSFLAKKIKDLDHIHYVMISSRKVYGASVQEKCFTEDEELSPDTPYGVAKMKIEHSLSKIIPFERLTILRPSNIFGAELNRRTFFGFALTKLINEKKIIYDFSPLVKRDFLSVQKFSQDLVKIALARRGGIYNLGSGFGVQCGDIAQWLIEGYGLGELIVTEDTQKDAFWLDMTRTKATFGLQSYSKDALRSDCVNLGRFYSH